VHKRIMSTVKRVEFVRNKMSYVILRGRRCDIFFRMFVHQTEDKIDYVKDSFHEELERVFDKFPK
jgi:hypothetical protein